MIFVECAFNCHAPYVMYYFCRISGLSWVVWAYIAVYGEQALLRIGDQPPLVQYWTLYRISWSFTPYWCTNYKYYISTRKVCSKPKLQNVPANNCHLKVLLIGEAVIKANAGLKSFFLPKLHLFCLVQLDIKITLSHETEPLGTGKWLLLV